MKHQLIQVDRVKTFEITKPLLQSIKQSRRRYEEKLKATEQKQSEKPEEKAIQERNELLNIEKEISRVESGIEVAEKAISDGSKKLNQHFAANVLDPEKLHLINDNQMIQMGLLR